MPFAGRVVFVTGAGSGMGRLAARRMADAGAKVAAVDVDTAGLAATAEGRERIHTCRLDVTDSQAVLATVKAVEDRLGPIDRVYNAAAIMPTGLLMEQDTETITRIMRVDYDGVVHVAKATLPGMLERGRGDLINFASIAGWGPTLHFGAYNAAKFAVVAFSEVLHHENRGRGVRIIAVCRRCSSRRPRSRSCSRWASPSRRAGCSTRSSGISRRAGRSASRRRRRSWHRSCDALRRASCGRWCIASRGGSR
jgi:NAD(P)-dependent dehydrogenase (short-subunit alcohol dehydrogenase family)